MKKLMFATALAASVAAFATDPINAISFESYSPGATMGANGAAESNDYGTGPFFYFDGGEGVSNSSVVTNGSPSTKKTAYFAEAANNNNYLALDTEGGTFWRSIGTISNTEVEGVPTYGLGTAQTVAATGTYLDTLVQFTVTEDDAPTTTSDDKLAIWLGVSTNAQGEVTGTNLMVRANYWEAPGEDPVPTDFVTTGATIIPGNWYRLTVKAIPTVMSRGVYPAFQIFVDGNEIASLTAQYSDGEDGFQDAASAYWSEGMGALAAANKLFPTLAEKPDAVEDVTLQGVGFQGTGAVDEIVWTEEDLFPAGGPTVVDYTFTLTLNANVTGADVTTNGVAVVFDNDTAQIVEGTTVSIAQPTFANGYQLDTITTNNVVIASPSFPIEFTMDGAMTVEITSEQIPATYPSYVGENATLRTQYDAWKALTGNTADTASAYEKQFLLNVTQATTVADDALQIDSITENATAGWDIVVSTTVSGAALSKAAEGDTFTTTYNGYLLVKSADTLAGLESATPTQYAVTAVTGGKVSITVTTGKFMKVVLTTTAPAAPSGGEETADNAN